MATAVNHGDLIELTAICKLNNQYSQNVRHYLVDMPIAVTLTDQTIVNDLELLFAVDVKPMLSAAASWLGMKAQIIRPVRRDYVTSVSNAGVGSQATDPLAPQTAGLITIRTGFADKRKRGRFYVPFPAEGRNTVAGIPDATYLTNLSSLATTLAAVQTFVVGADDVFLRPVIFSRVNNSPTAVVSAIRREVWATMRKRSFMYGSDDVPI